MPLDEPASDRAVGPVSVIDGRVFLKYMDENGQRQLLDLTAAIEAAAKAAVKLHEKDYHGGFG